MSTAVISMAIGGGRMAFAVVTLTVGIQVIIFHLAHMLSSGLTSSMLAVFYSGVALSALVCNRLKLYLSWNKERVTTFNIKLRQINYSLNLAQMMLLVTAIMLSILFNIKKLGAGDHSFIIYVAIFMAAFLYELVSLSLLDRIGYEENQMNSQNLIMKTYGMMGVCSAIGFWLLISFKTNMNVIILLLISCIVSTAFSSFQKTC